MKFLIDADFLVALAKEDDAHHAWALRITETLKEASIFITPFAIPETATVLSYKVSQKAAKEFLISARKRHFIELPLDEGVIKETDAIFLMQKKKGTSWIDCLNVSCVKIYQLDGILSFDKFYKKAGIKTFTNYM